MHRRHLVVPGIVLVAVTFYSRGLAQVPTRVPLQILGAGNKSCGVWTKEAGGPNRSGNEEWVLGFVTSIHQERAMRVAAGELLKPLERADARDILSFVDKYCEDRPSHPVFDAAFSVLTRLGHQWPAPTPPRREYR